MIKVRVISRVLGCRLFSTNPSATENAAKNVNMTDVKHHEELSGDWWNPYGQMKGLHAFNKIRVPLIRDGLISTGAVQEQKINKTNVLEGLKILEVGCGAGILTQALGRLKANVTALDPSHVLLEKAKEHLNDSERVNIEFTCDSIENHAETNKEKYDAVVASEVIEHVVDQTSFLNACVETLKPGGSIFITTFNKTQASWLAGIVVAEHVMNLIPKNTHDWNLFISPAELEKMLKDVNCSTLLVHGMQYEFWRNEVVWSSYKGVNYALHAVKNEN